MQSEITELKSKLMEAQSKSEKEKEDLERALRGIREQLKTANQLAEEQISVSEGLKRSQIMDKIEIENLEKRIEEE